MDITLEQLRAAVRRCTPGAPDSYAGRLWEALEQAQGSDAGGCVPPGLPPELAAEMARTRHVREGLPTHYTPHGGQRRPLGGSILR